MLELPKPKVRGSRFSVTVLGAENPIDLGSTGFVLTGISGAIS